MLIINDGTVKDEEQRTMWLWTQHREDNNIIPITNTNDEMIEEEKEEEMTNDEMIDSLTSLLNYWSYSNTQKIVQMIKKI